MMIVPHLIRENMSKSLFQTPTLIKLQNEQTPHQSELHIQQLTQNRLLFLTIFFFVFEFLVEIIYIALGLVIIYEMKRLLILAD